MNLDRMIEDWKALKRRIRKQWSRLTEQDLEELDTGHGLGGLSRALQKRYGISKKQAQEDLEAFGGEIGTTFREAAALVGDAARGAWHHSRDRVKETVESGKDRARELFEGGKDRARDLLEGGRERFDEYVKKTERAVRTRPMASIAVAAGIGALLVLLFRWRR